VTRSTLPWLNADEAHQVFLRVLDINDKAYPTSDETLLLKLYKAWLTEKDEVLRLFFRCEELHRQLARKET
jgi:hypothetical protein